MNIGKEFRYSSEQWTNNCLGWVLLYAFAAACVALMLYRNHEKGMGIAGCWNGLFLVFPIAAYFLLVSKMAVYVTDRYMFPIYAVVIAFFLTVFYKGAAVIFTKERNRQCLMVILAIIILINSWKNIGWPYLYQSSYDRLEQAENNSDLNAIMVYDTFWKTEPAFKEISNYNSLTVYQSDHINLTDYKYATDRELICVVIGDNEKILNSVLSYLPYINKYEKISSFSYHTTYHLYGDGKDCTIQTYDKTGYLNQLEQTITVSKTVSMELYMTSASDGYVQLLTDGKALDVKQGTFSVGTGIQLYALNGTQAQNWKFCQNDDGSYTIEAGDARYCLAYDNDGNVFLAEKNGTDNEKWWVEYE